MRLLLSIVVLIAAPVTVGAQVVPSPTWPAPPSDSVPRAAVVAGQAAYPPPAYAPPLYYPSEDLAARVRQLEADNQRVRAELEWMRQNPIQVAPPPAQGGQAVTPVAGAEVLAPPGPTMQQVQAEIKKFAWKKGDFTIVPYGWLWGNMVYETQRTNPGSYALFVQSPLTGDEQEFVADGRNTRLGIDVSGPQIPFFCCAKSGGKVEIDFQGSFAGTTVQENKGTILLRHAYCEVKNDDFRLLAGQTWDVMSPLLPGMIMYSVGWDGGNIGYRRAQFRAERYFAASDWFLTTVQASVNQTPFESAGLFRSEYASWPIVEGRVAWTLGRRKGPDAHPITLGVSGHVGQEQYDIVGGPQDFKRGTWSGNVDFRVPFTSRCGFQMELFAGQNLDAFLGGIGQGIDPTTLEPIHAMGGWCDFWYDWTPCLHSHLGYSIDDPYNGDLFTKGERTYNEFVFYNFVYDLTKQFVLGLELSWWKTGYVQQPMGDSFRVEFMAKYGF